ncbi:MAG TPA: protein kinase [Kofleriaceae bacterium]|jgi:serine/threonine-protein kinase
MIGEVLGNYRIVASIDRGGMGNVFRAEHTHLGRPAAIKLLRSELTANDELVQRFFNEAKAATAIRHPGIVEVYDFGYTEDGRAYIVMELLEGSSLSKRIETGGRMSEKETIRIARGLASVLKAAHGKGIVHRDLKPDNIFLVADDEEENGRVKVLDFGVAKLAEVPGEMSHTQTGMLMGTPLYMAPEQARAAGTIDHRADLYSVGCIMYELLTGKPPFIAEGAGEIIALQLFADPESLRGKLPDLSPELEAVVMKLLSKEPGDRYQSALELQQALAEISSRASGDLSRTRANSTGPTPRVTAQRAIKASRPPQFGSADFSGVDMTDERPVELAPQKKSSMGLVAGVVTVVLAGGAGLFAFVHSRGSSTAAPSAESGSAPAPAPAPTPVEATKTEPAKPEPAKTQTAPTPVEAKTEPTKTEPTKTEPTKTAPKKVIGKSGGTTAVDQKPVTSIGSSGPTTAPAGAVTSPGAVTKPDDVRTPVTNAPMNTTVDVEPKAEHKSEAKPEPTPEAKPEPKPEAPAEATP